MQTATRGNLQQATQHANGSWRVITLLTAMVVVLVGFNIFWLQWSSQQGITLGYPQPQVHIDAVSSNIRSQQNVNFTATASGRDLTYVWNFTRQNDTNSFFNNGNINGAATSATGQSLTHQFPASGTYTVTVKATDTLGHSSSNTRTVNVLPVPPVASFVAQTQTNAFFGGYEVSFDTSKSSVDPGTTIQGYTWDFGDGSASSTVTYAQASYSYANPGTYTVTLIVTDSTGQQSQPYKQTVTFQASAQ